ncbi:putative signal transducing protein [Nonlabens ponticola]|uniref:DUF2007 domain-containing protein n=1 Tax=Nonlabens ponticola TaxID=2496866 RepID=A0A3S9MVM6_9FLAO|nr:DUF2007 domain-containing protein [Nonlabens ponticola]AZQ43261.1 DUF2007 domain-containing protein [Nonlabens ponticola]
MKKFKTVAIFVYPAEAQVIKAKLESEGIDVFLRNEYTVAAEPFASNAMGGVKMQVYKEDFLRALGLIEKGSPDFSQTITELLKCPNCSKRSVREQHDVTTATNTADRLKAVLYSVVPFIDHKNYKCTSCAHEFDLNE